MPLPYIPETITVHLGTPASNAPNVTVPFPEYIKNVASSEIYPTWPENALRANIYAQISYALNRVYTEWYPSQGYDFDITNSTAYDQSFVPGREIFDNISRIVDELFDSYIVRRGAVEPLFAQYCNGTTVTCDGLSQWGTVPLAEQGLTPYEILQYYFGEDIDLVRNVPVTPRIGSYPGRALRLGSVGEDVRTIQLRLNRISTNYPAIPKIYPLSGFFDRQTEDAVRTFQRVFGLAEDGIVGKATWYRIAYLYTAIKGLSELSSEGLTLSEIEAAYPEVLRKGSGGLGVRVLQYFLAVLGNFYEAVPIIEIDGFFGPATENAVIAVQRLVGLPVTGVVDEATWNALLARYGDIVQAAPAGTTVYDAPLFPGRLLLTGLSGEDVRQVQTFLAALSGVYPQIPAIPITGYYGEQTQAAVLAAQQLFGQTPSGVVGPETWTLLAREYQKITAE